MVVLAVVSVPIVVATVVGGEVPDVSKTVVVGDEDTGVDADTVVGFIHANDMVSGIVVVVPGGEVEVEAEVVMPVVVKADEVTVAVFEVVSVFFVVGEAGDAVDVTGRGIKDEDELGNSEAVRKVDEKESVVLEDVEAKFVDGFIQPARVNP